MHELSVTQNMLELVLTEVDKTEAARVMNITLVIGELSSIFDESIQLYFDMLSEDTKAAGAQLIFRHIPASLCCTICDKVFPKTGSDFTCPECGGWARLIGDAKDFYIDSIEVE
ncbi:MAG: hydrogenase maturation nickel metallochaperone HypA [bacterium]